MVEIQAENETNNTAAVAATASQYIQDALWLWYVGSSNLEL